MIFPNLGLNEHDNIILESVQLVVLSYALIYQYKIIMIANFRVGIFVDFVHFLDQISM